MQHQYAGDIGDYLKLGILRTLGLDRSIGVAWWLHPDEPYKGDGRHVSYLDHPKRWRSHDPSLFDGLSAVVKGNRRSVAALTEMLCGGTAFSGEPIPIHLPPSDRPAAREAWFSRVQADLKGADFVFVDPDNGLEPTGYNARRRNSGKSVLIRELKALATPGRTLLVYHHQTRKLGGHLAELRYWGDRLRASGFRTVDALRARPYSPRAFFLLNADAEIRNRATAIERKFLGCITWHPDCT